MVSGTKFIIHLVLEQQKKKSSILSDREGQGHKAVVYKSHFPATKALDSQTV